MKFKKIIALLVVLTLMTACNDKEQDLTWLEGTWVSAENYAYDDATTSSQLYRFKEDGTFFVLNRVINNGNVNDVLGYTYFAEGLFILNESVLKLSFEEIYYNDDSLPYQNEIEDLVPSEDRFDEEFRVLFNQDQSELKLIYPPCPPSANCIGNQSFNRLASFD